MKRIIALLLCLSMIIGITPILAEQGASDDEIYAEIIVTEKLTAINMEKYDFTSTANSYEIVKRAGRYAMYMNPSKGCQYMRYNLDDELFEKTPDGGSYKVMVDYFDEGTGFFSIRYDAVNNPILDIQRDHPEVIRMTNTKQWKSHTFYISDADFGGEWQGVDLQLALFSEVVREMSGEGVAIGGMRIEKTFPKVPVKTELTSDETGNIFSLDEEKNLIWKLENVTDVPIDVEMEYTIFDEYANQYSGGSVKTSMDGGEIFQKEFTAPISEQRPYGVYKVKVKGTLSYEYKGKNEITSIEGIYDYSVADKFKAGEARNEKLITATHIATQTHDPEKNAELITQAGFGGMRDEFRWERIEPEKGKYSLEGSFTYPEIYAKYGAKVFFTTGLGNKFYTDTYTDEDLAKDSLRVKGMPVTDEEREGFTNYILAVLDRYGDNISHVEIWNEPNHQLFNPLNRPPEVYAELVKYAYPRIKAKYPDIPIGAISTAALPFDWIEQVFATGALDYMDAVTVHPYQWNGVFSHEQFHKDLSDLQKLMEKYGAADKPVWATEWGFSSGTNYWGMKTAREQARCMLQFYTLANAYEYIDLFLLYNFQSKGVLPDDGEHNFGIVTYHLPQDPLPVENLEDAPSFDRYTMPYAAKPAYIALTEMNKILAGAENDRIYETPEGIDALGFKKANGETAIVMWSNDVQAENISFTASGSGEVRDLYGNKIMSVADGVTHTVTLDNIPKWIVGNISDVVFEENEVCVSASKLTIAAGDSFSVDVSDAKGRDLTTVVNCHKSFKTDGLTMKNGNGTISFSSDDDTQLNTYNITLEHYDGDILVAVNEVKVEIIDVIDIELVSKRDISLLDRHTVEVSIINKSTQRALSGDCHITEPVDFAQRSNLAKFSALKPGETIVIPLNIPRVVRKRYCDVTAEVEISTGKTFTKTSALRFESQLSRLQDPNIIPIYSTSKRGAPVIDGIATEDEWGESLIVIDSKQSLWEKFDGWTGPDDLSFKANVMWDKEYFYLCVDAKDNVHYQEYIETDMWKGDSIQFGIIEGEPDSLKSASYNEFGIALYGDEVRVYRSAQYKEQPIGVISNFKAKAKKNTDGVTYEIAIPWIEAMYAGFVPKVGDSAAFNMILNDNDGAERKGWIELGPGIGTGKNATKFKCIDFME